MNGLMALVLAASLAILPAAPDDSAFCEWLDLADTHYDVLAAFTIEAAYDLLAYPTPLANQVVDRLIDAGCDY